jgi:hypothetical protein
MSRLAETPPRISELTAGLAPNQSHSAPVQASAEARIAASSGGVERVAVRPSRTMTIRGSCLFIAALSQSRKASSAVSLKDIAFTWGLLQRV